MLSALIIVALSSSEPVKPKIVSASLFKNGYAVVVREVPLSATGEALVIEPRQAVLGTLWITGAKGTVVNSVVATNMTEEQTSPLGSIDDVLSKNVGKELTLTVIDPRGNETKPLTGTLKSASGGLVVLDMKDGQRLAFGKNLVMQVSSTTEGPVYETTGKLSRRALKINGTGKGKALVLSLEHGLSWVPAYHVDISDPKKLTLTSKATIVNDMEKIDGIDLRLITGFPNVRFINFFDPLTSPESLVQFVDKMVREEKAVADASPATQMLSNRAMGGFAGENFAFQPQGELTGSQLEDLFFTTQKNVTLDVGERGYYMQFQEHADYKHVYTLDLADSGWALYDRNQYPNQIPPPQTPDVWHTLEFTNPSANPLTTGTVTTFKEGEVIGQDMLTYTSPKSKASVRITKALDVRAEVIEEELDRQIRAIPATNYANAYDLVTAKGTIQITNTKTEDVAMKITKVLVGEVTSVSHGGNAKKSKGGLRAVNPNTGITWDVTVKKGEAVELTFDFKVYVPSR